jgi:hypothetical protein
VKIGVRTGMMTAGIASTGGLRRLARGGTPVVIEEVAVTEGIAAPAVIVAAVAIADLVAIAGIVGIAAPEGTAGKAASVRGGGAKRRG